MCGYGGQRGCATEKSGCAAVPAKADMMPLLHFIIDGKDPSRESSDVYGSHAFYSVSEFEELLNLIAPDGLKEKIKNKTIDKLFK